MPLSIPITSSEYHSPCSRLKPSLKPYLPHNLGKVLYKFSNAFILNSGVNTIEPAMPHGVMVPSFSSSICAKQGLAP